MKRSSVILASATAVALALLVASILPMLSSPDSETVLWGSTSNEVLCSSASTSA